MYDKKGQLSIETMIIWGLVILVTLSVIGGLLYFNVLDIAAYLPDRCELGGTGDLTCEEMSFSGGTLQLGIRNIGQKPIEELKVTIDDEVLTHFSSTVTADGKVGSSGGPTISTSDPLPPGGIASVTLSGGATGLEGRVLKGLLQTNYKFKDGAINQKSSGSVRIKAS